MDYQIISDSSCDLENEYVITHNVTIVPFYVSFDGETYLKEGVDVKPEDFCRKMASEKIYPKTSLPSIRDYEECFEHYARQNIPVICITLNAKFSGSYQSALNAKDLVLESIPEAKIAVINSTLITSSQNLLVREAVRMQEDGVPYYSCVNRIETLRHTGHVLFTIENMEYLKKGGRIGKLLTMAGTRLGIRPIITMEDGVIVGAGIARSRGKARKKIVELTKEHLSKMKLPLEDYLFCVGAGLDMEEAMLLKEDLEQALNITGVNLIQIGATICSHTGPEIIGIALLQRYDT